MDRTVMDQTGNDIQLIKTTKIMYENLYAIESPSHANNTVKICESNRRTGEIKNEIEFSYTVDEDTSNICCCRKRVNSLFNLRARAKAICSISFGNTCNAECNCGK